MSELPAKEQAERLQMLYRVGVALSGEHNRARLVEMILLEAKELCNADGGTLYLRTDDEHLRFVILRSDSLGIARGGTTGEEVELPPLPLLDAATGKPNLANVATAAANLKRSINVPDAYDSDEFDFTGTKAFDERAGYRSQSFLTIPLLNAERGVIAVLQLLNARNSEAKIVPFSEDKQQLVEALAAQAGIALDNQLLLQGQKDLLESFIKLIAAAIDAKSPYTGGHCERVPVLTEMLTRAACNATDGPFADFQLNDDEWYELRIAAWLHDCGKVTTPVHVMDKATKLESIYDRIASVRQRFETLERDAELAHLRRVIDGQAPEASREAFDHEVAALRDDLAFLETSNVGGEFLDDEAKARIRAIGARRIRRGHEECALLDDDEIESLCISRGTLTREERIVINGHMVQTILMLEALPFPRNLRRVPEYAGGHHEKMDGGGYPKGIYAGDMSVPARIMAIADVFEALTAQDRPYKVGKTLSESMRIMGEMKRWNHLDPKLFDLFVRSGVYREYGRLYLPESLLDDVDEASLLAIEPKGFDLPPSEVRSQRWRGFLPEYST